MLSGGYKEMIEQTVRLPEDDADAFSLFMEWLYLGHLSPVKLDHHTTTSGPIYNRIKLYCFAEKHCLVDLMDYTMSSLMSNYTKHTRLPTIEVMQYVYENTVVGSKLRAFIARSLRYIISELSGSSFWPSEKLGRLMMDVEELTMDCLLYT